MAEPRTARASSAAEPASETSRSVRHAAIQRTVGMIGQRVREQRRLHGLSLQQAAVLAGVSAASIHKVERGEMVPTVTTLLKLAGAFELPMSSFVDDSGNHDAGATLVRADERAAIASSWPSTTRASITADVLRFRLTGEVLEIATGGSGELVADPSTDERVWHLTDGALEVSTGGEPTVLRAGDTLQVPGDRPLTWRSTTRGVTRVVQVRLPHDRG